ncbi:MAG: tRNA lysidine(34) synthetase TilS [Anaeromyxobacteraceae bacterium]
MKARLSPFAAAVRTTLESRHLAGPADTVLVALSAGPDSTALVAALAELRDAGALGAVLALHVDHGLRPGGEADARSAGAACEVLGVSFRSVRVEVGSGNVQAAARRARYAALRQAAADAGATRIATGHTRTDQAETVLMRLLRGAGARGLAGIPPRRGAVIRPLIDRSRAEGLAHLVARGLAWRDDPTNATPRYLRNRIRQALWPAALALAPRAEEALARAADLAREDERALAARARRLVAAGDLGAARLARAPAAVRRRVVRALWRAAGSPAPLGAAHVEAVLGILGPGRPRRIRLPAGLEARVRAGLLELGPPREPVRAPRPARVEGPGRLRSGELELEIEARHPAAVPWPLELRGRRPGDRFRPEGGAGAKKLAAWLVDRKVPRDLRDGLVVLAAGAEVVAVPELGVVAEGYGARGAGLRVRVAHLPGGAPDGLQST